MKILPHIFGTLFSHPRLPIKPKFLTPAELQLNSLKAGQEAYQMEKYKCTIELFTRQLLKEHKKYKKSPESHPQYGEEWKKFWECRYYQLKKEGKINPNDYDFKPEWISFWTKRMEEIVEEAIEKKKGEVRKQLRLHDDYEQKVDGRKRQKSPNPSEYEEISSDDSCTLSDDSYRSPRRKKNSYYRHRSPDSDTRNFYRYEKVRSPSPARRLKFDENEEVTLVSVCRLLSALEAELGSLSDKILDLLAKALALEKLKPNSSDEMLMTSENAVFLETVKEKMKGLLMVNDLPVHKLAAVKKCIQNIAKLIHQTPMRKEEEKVAEKEEVNDKKTEIALKIAESLKACGKDDCTPEELEVLVEIYLEDCNNESDQPEADKSADLNDDELKILLGSFSELKQGEQDMVLKALSQLEKTHPERVEELRKYVNVDEDDDDDHNSNIDSNTSALFEIEDDPDDYNFSEVVNSVIANVQQVSSLASSQQQEVENPQDPSISLTDNLLAFGTNESWNNFYGNSWN